VLQDRPVRFRVFERIRKNEEGKLMQSAALARVIVLEFDAEGQRRGQGRDATCRDGVYA